MQSFHIGFKALIKLNLTISYWVTVFLQLVSAETILFWIWPVTVHKNAETIQWRKLFAEIFVCFKVKIFWKSHKNLTFPMFWRYWEIFQILWLSCNILAFRIFSKLAVLLQLQLRFSKKDTKLWKNHAFDLTFTYKFFNSDTVHAPP